MEQEVFTVGQLIGKDCLTCGVEQSHQVLTVTKKGLISKVVCAVCAVTSSFKTAAKSANANSEQKTGEPYDRMLTYRKGQTMMHDSFGYGEVMSVIEPRKIDVKFIGGLRRLIHAQR
jgi:transcription elongation factor Elf1